MERLHSHILPGTGPPNAFRVTNIAAGLGDRKFFEALQFLHLLKSRSLQGKLRQLFTIDRYTVDLVKVGSFLYSHHVASVNESG